MRIVVTGGSGFIGGEVVRRLLESGADDVVVTSRSPESRGHSRSGVQLVQAFAGDAVSLGKAFTRAEVVVHAIQFPNHPVEDPSRGRTYLEVDGQGTEVAVRVAKALGVRRFVYVSGAGAGQGRPQPWFRAKDRAEAAIRDSGMQHAIMRPSWIYGPRDRSMNRFVSFCRSLPVVPVIGDGKTRVQPIFVEDVARCVAEAVLREDCKDKTFELGGPERLSMDEIIRTIQSLLRGSRPLPLRLLERLIGQPLLHHPTKLMKLLVLPMQLLPEPMLSSGAIDFIVQEVEIDPRPALEYFGFPFRPLREGLRQYLP
jgi:NADH dehydrogenase